MRCRWDSCLEAKLWMQLLYCARCWRNRNGKKEIIYCVCFKTRLIMFQSDLEDIEKEREVLAITEMYKNISTSVKIGGEQSKKIEVKVEVHQV